MHKRFIEPTKGDADLVIPEGANSVAVYFIQEKLRAEIDGDTTHT
jgi:uridine kinase